MKEYRFKAIIQSADGNNSYILFPYDAKEEFGTRAHIPVKATFDGVSYSGSLVKYGPPQHMLPILKNVREQIRKSPGDTVDVVIVRDESIRTVEVPLEFARAMKAGGVLPVFAKLSYTHRKEYCRWISEAKRAETRKSRIAKGVEMLRKGLKTPD